MAGAAAQALRREIRPMKTNQEKWDVVVLGGVNEDYLVSGSELPQGGQTVQGDAFFCGCGGKGANQAVAAARLGAKVCLVGCVGRDAAGERAKSVLRREKVGIEYLFGAARQPTGRALIMVNAKGEKQIMAAPGANHSLTQRHLQSARKVLEGAKVLLIQFEVPPALLLTAARWAKQGGAFVVLDPAPPAKVPSELYRYIDVIRPNADEAKQLTGVDVADVKSAERAARALMKLGPRIASVQAGSRGDLIVWPEGEHLVRWFRVKTVDATGAGDAYAAALAVGLKEGKDPRSAGEFASATAALTTTKVGAQSALPTRGEVMRLLKREGRG